MTAFTKQNLVRSGDSIIFIDADGARQFLARFKYAARSSIGPAMTFLRKNFTADEYLNRKIKGESPLEILESKGFVLSHIKRWLKDAGYPQTQRGFAQWRRDRYLADGNVNLAEYLEKQYAEKFGEAL